MSFVEETRVWCFHSSSFLASARHQTLLPLWFLVYLRFSCLISTQLFGFQQWKMASEAQETLTPCPCPCTQIFGQKRASSYIFRKNFHWLCSMKHEAESIYGSLLADYSKLPPLLLRVYDLTFFGISEKLLQILEIVWILLISQSSNDTEKKCINCLKGETSKLIICRP
ncbi:hypothetical protein V6N13_100459 [Hibiscus sabdariffa]